MSYALANRVVAIDPGHGGPDPGAKGKISQEKDITLAISKRLADYFSQAGAMVIVLRQDDHDLAGDFKGSLLERKRKDLSLRLARAQENHADLYISIHTNADPSPRWYGAQTFYNGKSQAGKPLAESIQKELVRILGNTRREAKAGSYYILDRASMPAVIVEAGFLSNPREEQLLNSPDYQSKLAYAIYSGVVKTQPQN
jgi:N-acetylmuramoyl-L-alanine amidase